MKKQQAKKDTSKVSPFWKPESEGETITGKFGGFLKAVWKGDTIYSMRLGEKQVAVGAVIASIVRGNPDVFVKGSELTITYLGRKKRMKLFAVTHKGKLLPQDNAFGEEISTKDFLSASAKKS